MLIDTHCHLNSLEHFPDPDREIQLAADAGVGALLIVGTTPEDGRYALEIAERNPNVFAIIGFHPNYCADYSSDRLSELRPLLAHPKCLALGEIGLDYHWDHTPRNVQFQALQDQLDLAAEVNLPVVFHCREAYPDLLDILEARPKHPYLIHCFAGDSKDAERSLALGCLFGVDGPITYKRSEQLREIMRTIGLDRIVLETDSPYLSPEPHRGKPNHPSFVRLIGRGLAETLGVDFAEVEAKTTENARRFFGLPC